MPSSRREPLPQTSDVGQWWHRGCEQSRRLVKYQSVGGDFWRQKFFSLFCLRFTTRYAKDGSVPSIVCATRPCPTRLRQLHLLLLCTSSESQSVSQSVGSFRRRSTVILVVFLYARRLRLILILFITHTLVVLLIGHSPRMWTLQSGDSHINLEAVLILQGTASVFYLGT